MGSSLYLRVLLVGIAAALILPFVAALGLRMTFERHAEAATVAELEADLRYLTRSLWQVDGSVRLVPAMLPDPRFQEPLSGLYWQIVDDADGSVSRSPSLLTFTIDLPRDELDIGTVHRHELPGPDGSSLLVLERRIPQANPAKAAYRFAVAIDTALLDSQARAFMAGLWPVLGASAALLLLAASLQTGVALAPIQTARRALGEVRAGRKAGLSGTLPRELEPLAADFDALLAARESVARKARERAADLAHGLRTPLAVLQVRADEADAAGAPHIAASIREVAQDLQYKAARELALAGIQGPIPGRTETIPVAPAINRIVSALSRIPARIAGERVIDWEVDVPASARLRMDPGDLVEMLGPLLENAAQWSQSRVRIAAQAAGAALSLQVDDDGCGIAPQDRRTALSRGGQLEAQPGGNGLGLAIASEIAQAYGGSLSLEDSPLGGLRVQITLPGLAAIQPKDRT